MMLTAIVTLMVAAFPSSPLRGMDKPVKEERGTLGNSELTKGKIKIYCADVGRWMLVEVNDPGLKGAKDIWLRKKTGDSMPPCDANETGVTHLQGAAEYGYLAGVKGAFVFVLSADTASDFQGVRVYSLNDGSLVYDGTFFTPQPITLVVENKTTLMRFHREVRAACQPTGAEAAACWKKLRDDAQIPADVEITPPPCDALLKANPALLGALVSVPVEIDLSSSKTVKFRSGAATCSVAE